MSHTPSEVTAQVMSENGLTADTVLHRHTLTEFLTEADGQPFISANADPSEAVIDIYGNGHQILAVHAGPGLAFVSDDASEWQDDDRSRVSVRLGDTLEQGGRIYPVDSVITAKVWYLTLPSGGVAVTVG